MVAGIINVDNVDTELCPFVDNARWYTKEVVMLAEESPTLVICVRLTNNVCMRILELLTDFNDAKRMIDGDTDIEEFPVVDIVR